MSAMMRGTKRLSMLHAPRPPAGAVEATAWLLIRRGPIAAPRRRHAAILTLHWHGQKLETHLRNEKCTHRRMSPGGMHTVRRALIHRGRMQRPLSLHLPRPLLHPHGAGFCLFASPSSSPSPLPVFLSPVPPHPISLDLSSILT